VLTHVYKSELPHITVTHHVSKIHLTTLVTTTLIRFKTVVNKVSFRHV
jgi:hypothetical protein